MSHRIKLEWGFRSQGEKFRVINKYMKRKKQDITIETKKIKTWKGNVCD